MDLQPNFKKLIDGPNLNLRERDRQSQSPDLPEVTLKGTRSSSGRSRRPLRLKPRDKEVEPRGRLSQA